MDIKQAGTFAKQIAWLLIVGIPRAVASSILLMAFGRPTLRHQSNIFWRLLFWPQLLSASLAATYFAYAIVVAAIFFERTYFWGLVTIPFLVFSYILSKMMRRAAEYRCKLSRIRGWIGHKFDNDEAVFAWIDATGPMKLESLLQLPVDSWEPNPNGGSTLLATQDAGKN